MALSKILLLGTILFLRVFNPSDDFSSRLSEAAIELTKQNVTYDPRYFSISYPNGDIPADKGVCTDVVIRAYRKLGIEFAKGNPRGYEIEF